MGAWKYSPNNINVILTSKVIKYRCSFIFVSSFYFTKIESNQRNEILIVLWVLIYCVGDGSSTSFNAVGREDFHGSIKYQPHRSSIRSSCWGTTHLVAERYITSGRQAIEQVKLLVRPNPSHLFRRYHFLFNIHGTNLSWSELLFVSSSQFDPLMQSTSVSQVCPGGGQCN